MKNKFIKMLNKYYVRLPYSCSNYGNITGYVYAEDEEEAQELAEDTANIYEEEYDDNDSDNYNYYYEDMSVELEEEDVPENRLPNGYYTTVLPSIENSILPSKIPSYFLEEIHLL